LWKQKSCYGLGGVFHHKGAARDIESAYRIKLAKGEVGLEEPKRVPTFAAALKEFLAWSEHQHSARPSTHHRRL
jgi:hypothetical protein